MTSTNLARLTLLGVVALGFGLVAWHLYSTAPKSERERPEPPTPLVDVIDSTPRDHPLQLRASGTITSAQELDIRPQVGGRLLRLHPDFEPGGWIAAGETLVVVDPEEYQLAVSAAEADVAKARASIVLEQGRRVVAREELDSLQDSVRIDAASQALALRKPQLRQVQADLAAAENRLQRARLDLQRTELQLPFDIIVLERSRVGGEVVAERELVGRVARADEYWLELRVRPEVLPRIAVRSGDRAGSTVHVFGQLGVFRGEVVRVRADLASGSRLAGVIVAIPMGQTDERLLLGNYVEAEIDAGLMPQLVRTPRRALRDNRRVWVVDRNGRLRIRDAEVAWESGQQLFLKQDTLLDGDKLVVSRIDGLVAGAEVRHRRVDPDNGGALITETAAKADD